MEPEPVYFTDLFRELMYLIDNIESTKLYNELINWTTQ